MFEILPAITLVVGYIIGLRKVSEELKELQKTKLVIDKAQYEGPNEVILYSSRVDEAHRLWKSDDLRVIPELLEQDIIYVVIALFRQEAPPKSIVVKPRDGDVK
jgi:hypothetical protein